jgi:hypothetical protein
MRAQGPVADVSRSQRRVASRFGCAHSQSLSRQPSPLGSGSTCNQRCGLGSRKVVEGLGTRRGGTVMYDNVDGSAQPDETWGKGEDVDGEEESVEAETGRGEPVQPERVVVEGPKSLVTVFPSQGVSRNRGAPSNKGK